jgi:hypothetical protein
MRYADHLSDGAAFVVHRFRDKIMFDKAHSRAAVGFGNIRVHQSQLMGFLANLFGICPVPVIFDSDRPNLPGREIARCFQKRLLLAA